MTNQRASFASVRVAACLGLSLLGSPLCAQTFVELGSGWNRVAPAPYFEGYTHGFNVRASFGWKVSPRVRFRLDALLTQFDDSLGIDSPGGVFYQLKPVTVTGLTANWLVNFDPHEIFYLIGGAGFYDATGRPGRREDGLNVGVSAGAGIALPIGPRLRAFFEAHDHVMLGKGSEPPWLVPFTIGFRY
jgi:hypothetical protein